jgi:hypothetical protein
MHVRHLLVLLSPWDIRGGGGRRPMAYLTVSLHPAEYTIPQTGVPSMGRPRIMAMTCSITVISPDGRWNVWVPRRHQSMSVINAAASINDRSRLTSRASGRNTARRMNGSYRLSQCRGCVCGSRAASNIVEHNNSKNILAPCA